MIKDFAMYKKHNLVRDANLFLCKLYMNLKIKKIVCMTENFHLSLRLKFS